MLAAFGSLKVAQCLTRSPSRQMRVVGKPGSDIPVLPAAAVLERLRQIPVVETNPRLDIGSHDRIDEPIVEFQSLLVWATPSFRQDARPRGRQTIGTDPQLAHQRHVLRPAMVMVASDVAVVTAENLAGEMAESIPDRRPAPVLCDGALDLVGRRRGAPQKTVRKTGRHLAVPRIAAVGA